MTGDWDQSRELVDGIRRVVLQGHNPFEIGQVHGHLLKDEIHKQIEIYKAMFEYTSKLDWPAVRSIAVKYNDTIAQLTPHLHRELEGIASTAEVDLLDIVALNCRSEIALGEFSDGCTSLAWKVEEQNTMYLAQNWDWVKVVGDNLVLMTIKQEGKPEIRMATEAGIIGKIGYNTNGIGVCLNAIRAHPINYNKLPIHIALRVCLDSTTVEDARGFLTHHGTASSQHILIADNSTALSMELSPNGHVFIEPKEDNLVVHTNHFIQNKLVDEPPWLSGSPIRLNRASALVKTLDRASMSAGKLRDRIFTDLFNAPQSICCQEDMKRDKHTRSMTLFNVVMVFKDREEPKAELVLGRPGSGNEGAVITF